MLKKKISIRTGLLLLVAMFCLQPLSAQTNTRIEELKSKRGELQKQIKQSESLLLSTNKDVKSQLNDLALINSQLDERRKYIAAIEADVNALQREMNKLSKQMKQLKADLKDKQQKYASSLSYLRKNRSIEERLMFIFSAQTLSQTYRRLRYVNEYADYQRKQGEQIKETQAEVKAKQEELTLVKNEKDSLLIQSQVERKKIQEKEAQQRQLVNKLQKKQRNLQEELKKQRKQSQRLNAQIDKLIEQEIAAAKKRAEEEERKRRAAAQKEGAGGKGQASGKGKDVPMMEEYVGDRKLSGVFESNKGKLPIPITGPYAVVSRFGQYTVDGLKNVKLDNKGIDIKGNKGAKARSVFNGEVSAIFQFNGMVGVLVRHGSYISVYCNLSSASVKKGQKLNTGDLIGPIATDSSGNTILHFQLRKETTKLNPALWLGR